MIRYFSILFLLLISIACFASETDFLGNWISTDLDYSKIQLSKSKNGTWTAIILDSENKAYLNQTIFTGRFIASKDYIEGTFVTPKSKMNISTKIYLQDKNTIRFVGKKYFITKTYLWTRQK